MSDRQHNDVSHDDDIREAMNMSITQPEPSENLSRKLRVMAAETKSARRPWWQSRLAMVSTAAAAIAVTAFVMMPTKASAKTYELLVAAANQVNAFQFTINTDEKGENKLMTISGANGRFSIQTDEKPLMMIDGQGLSIYDPTENVVTRFSFGGLVDAQTIAREMDAGLAEAFENMNLKKMLEEYSAKYGTENIQISPVTTENGRSVYRVELASPEEPNRVRMIVDASTDLPRQILVEEMEGGAWRQSMKMDLRYGSEVDFKILDGKFPAGAKTVDLNLGSMVQDSLKGLESIDPAIKKLDSEWKGSPLTKKGGDSAKSK